MVGRLEERGPGRAGDPPGGTTTTHRVHFVDVSASSRLAAETVELVVTSPPYPMIEMWDGCFAGQDPEIGRALAAGRGWDAFEAMHALLDRVWEEMHRLLVPGGIGCINIGDAVRTIENTFVLYPNHMRILSSLVRLGFNPLPAILWRKQTNAPNKFMGSGMFPPGAYVTLEHEFILIVRKGEKRTFSSDEARARRQESSFFWEERNGWFSDVWLDLKGTGQDLLDPEARQRSGAYPFELAYRLISMFSVKGDTVLDPFLGTGTTMLAAMAAARNSLGFELDGRLKETILARTRGIVDRANGRIAERLAAHESFIRARHEAKGRFGYRNLRYGFPVVTRQEVNLLLSPLAALRAEGEDTFIAEHSRVPQPEFCADWSWFFDSAPGAQTLPSRPSRVEGPRLIQKDLFQPRERG
jgi:DNA modification methylase